jgi:GNAT superfamily N-acetyltransferase
MQTSLQLRKARDSDIPRVLALGLQLGYPNELQAFTARFQEISKQPDHLIMVIEDSSESFGKVVAQAHFKIHRGLFVESALEVAAVVVDESYRGQGLGKRLLAQAEITAKEWGLKSVRLTSNIKRSEAHQFYLSLGYTQPKTSHFFTKQL